VRHPFSILSLSDVTHLHSPARSSMHKLAKGYKGVCERVLRGCPFVPLSLHRTLQLALPGGSSLLCTDRGATSCSEFASRGEIGSMMWSGGCRRVVRHSERRTCVCSGSSPTNVGWPSSTSLATTSPSMSSRVMSLSCSIRQVLYVHHDRVHPVSLSCNISLIPVLMMSSSCSMDRCLSWLVTERILQQRELTLRRHKVILVLPVTF
jgi:hypothetical protein